MICAERRSLPRAGATLLHSRVSVETNVVEGAREIRQLEEGGLASPGGSGPRALEAPLQVGPREKQPPSPLTCSRDGDAALGRGPTLFSGPFSKVGPITIAIGSGRIETWAKGSSRACGRVRMAEDPLCLFPRGAEAPCPPGVQAGLGYSLGQM